MSDSEKKLTKTAVKALGFTDKLIQQLLPEPILVPNPMYKKAPPMSLWSESDVLLAIQTEEFKQYQEKVKGRRNGALKAVSTKKKKLAEEFDIKASMIKVKSIPLTDLDYKVKLDHEIFGELDKDTLDRWRVNFIRHNLTYYDNDLLDLKGRVGKHDVYAIYKIEVLKKISEVHPYLEEECKKQIARCEQIKF